MNFKRKIEIEKEAVEEIKPQKKKKKDLLEENREKWFWLRDELLNRIQNFDFNSITSFKIANEIITAIDKALREADKTSISLNFVKNVFTDGENTFELKALPDGSLTLTPFIEKNQETIKETIKIKEKEEC